MVEHGNVSVSGMVDHSVNFTLKCDIGYALKGIGPACLDLNCGDKETFTNLTCDRECSTCEILLVCNNQTNVAVVLLREGLKAQNSEKFGFKLHLN